MKFVRTAGRRLFIFAVFSGCCRFKAALLNSNWSGVSAHLQQLETSSVMTQLCSDWLKASLFYSLNLRSVISCAYRRCNLFDLLF